MSLMPFNSVQKKLEENGFKFLHSYQSKSGQNYAIGYRELEPTATTRTTSYLYVCYPNKTELDKMYFRISVEVTLQILMHLTLKL